MGLLDKFKKAYGIGTASKKQVEKNVKTGPKKRVEGTGPKKHMEKMKKYKKAPDREYPKKGVRRKDRKARRLARMAKRQKGFGRNRKQHGKQEDR